MNNIFKFIIFLQYMHLEYFEKYKQKLFLDGNKQKLMYVYMCDYGLAHLGTTLSQGERSASL